MGIRFQCPNGHPLNVKSYLAGRRGICPQCDARFLVPAASGQCAVPVSERSAATKPSPIATAEPTPGTPDQNPGTPDQNPGTPDQNPGTPDRAPQWYARSESGQLFGPVGTGVIQHWLVEGRVSAHDWVWRTGWPQWMRASEAFIEMLNQPPALPPDASASCLPAGPTQSPVSTSSQQPVTLIEPALADAPDAPSVAHRGQTGHRKKKREQITFWLALAVVLLFVALLVIVLG
jgi:hypothetical protein